MPQHYKQEVICCLHEAIPEVISPTLESDLGNHDTATDLGCRLSHVDVRRCERGNPDLDGPDLLGHPISDAVWLGVGCWQNLAG